jgi:uncharacterized membrane protein
VSAATGSREHHRLSLVLVAVASVLAFFSLFALWANRQFLNTDNWTDSSTKLLENKDIRTQLSIFLVDSLYNNVDVAGQLKAALPPRLQPLAGPAAGALRSPAQSGTAALLDRPRVQRLWEQANRRAHKRLLDVLEDRGTNVSTANGDVTLNLQGILAQNERFAGLSKKLPPDAAQLEIIHSDQLELAQDLTHFMKALAIVLVALALGLLALAVYLARDWRREALRDAGIGLAAAGALGLIARGLAGNALTDSLAKTDSVKPAIHATWDISTSLFQQAAVATLLYGLVILLAAWLAGPGRAAVSTRTGLAPWLREPRFAYGGLAAIVLLVVAWGPTPATRKFLPVVIMIGLLVWGMEVLRRQTAHEHPDASRHDQMESVRAWFSTVRQGRTAREDDRLDQLERLGKLRDTGVIDAAEFDREKTRLLGEVPAGAG